MSKLLRALDLNPHIDSYFLQHTRSGFFCKDCIFCFDVLVSVLSIVTIVVLNIYLANNPLVLAFCRMPNYRHKVQYTS